MTINWIDQSDQPFHVVYICVANGERHKTDISPAVDAMQTMIEGNNLGYGKQAMQALIELVKTELLTCTGISLVVHPANVVAQSLYQQSGFVATGAERWDEPVYRSKFA